MMKHLAAGYRLLHNVKMIPQDSVTWPRPIIYQIFQTAISATAGVDMGTIT